MLLEAIILLPYFKLSGNTSILDGVNEAASTGLIFQIKYLYLNSVFSGVYGGQGKNVDRDY